MTEATLNAAAEARNGSATVISPAALPSIATNMAVSPRAARSRPWAPASSSATCSRSISRALPNSTRLPATVPVTP